MRSWFEQLHDWARRLCAWLLEASSFWLAVSGPPLVLIAVAIPVSSCEQHLRLSGMFLEIFGLATVVWGLMETRKLFGEASLIDKSKAWLLAFPRYKRQLRIAAGAGHIKLGGATVQSYGEVLISPEATVEQRLIILEANLRNVTKAFQELHKKTGEDRTAHRKALESEKAEREAADHRTGGLLKAALAGGLNLEAMGAFWLFLGMVMATASAELASCGLCFL